MEFLFLILYLAPRPRPPPPPSPLPPCHTPSFTHNFVTPLFVTHTQLCHTSSFTHNFVTHNLSCTTLSHTTLSRTTLLHTIFHTQLCHTPLCHTPSFTHNFVTHNFVCHTQLCHTQTLSHILQHKPSPTHHLSTQTFSHSAWQAWHLVTSTFHLRGRRGTWRRLRRGKHGACGTGLALVARLGRRGTLRSRRGACAPSTFAHPPSVCVAGVALGEMYLRLAWQVWHLWHWAGSGGVLGRRVSHSPGAPRHFAWRAWHSAALTPHLRGSRGTWWHLPAFGVAGVALVTGGALGRR